MNRRTFLAGLAALGLPPLLGACAGHAPPLRIGSHVWPGYEFMFLARREGWITDQDVSLVETGSATESVQLLAAGKVDGAALTLDEVLGARQRGLPLVVVLVFDISMGADVLLARSSIRDLGQLKGRRLGYEASAVGALMLHKALAAGGLRPDEVELYPVRPDQHEQVWDAAQVDALITFEPVASRLEGKGARHLFDSSQIPDTIFDVLAITPEAIRRNPGALHQLIAAHFRGIHNFRKNPLDTAYRMADRFHLPAKEVIAAYAGLELPNLYRNRKLLRDKDAGLLQAARELSGFLVQVGILPGPTDKLAGLVDAEFLPREEVA